MRERVRANEHYDVLSDKRLIKRSVAVLVILMIGLIAAFISYYISRMWFYVALGTTAAAVSLMVVIEKRDAYPEERLLPSIVLAAGLITAAAPLIDRFVLTVRLDEERHILIQMGFGGACFLLTGAALIAVLVYTAYSRKRRCRDDVMARCIALEERIGSRPGSKAYAPVWEYTSGSQTVEAAERSYSHRVPRVGDMRRIYVDPDDPEDIYRPDPLRTAGGCIVGSISILIGAAILITAII